MFKGTLRVLAFGNHLMVWLSSLIVMGILSYFLSKYSDVRTSHVIYQEVIAVLTVVVWTFGTILPFIDRYGGHLWPADVALSYLWLASFILSVEDWSGNRCRVRSPGLSHCGLKNTVTAFNFLAFFFLVCNFVIEGYLFRAHRNDRVHSLRADGSVGSVPTNQETVRPIA